MKLVAVACGIGRAPGAAPRPALHGDPGRPPRRPVVARGTNGSSQAVADVRPVRLSVVGPEPPAEPAPAAPQPEQREAQPAAAEAGEQQPRRLLPRDLAFARRQSRERVRMARGLGLARSGGGRLRPRARAPAQQQQQQQQQQQDEAPRPLPGWVRDVEVLEMGWASRPEPGPSEASFICPDPLALPCEEDTWFDAAGVEACWQAAAAAERQRQRPQPPQPPQQQPPAEAPAPPAAGEPEGGGGPSRQAPGPPAAVKVRWSYTYETEPGQRLWLLGDHESLGAWDVDAAVKLRWGEGHVWSAAVELDPGARVAYKAVLQLADGQRKWEAGPNHLLEVGEALEAEVQHTFKPQC